MIPLLVLPLLLAACATPRQACLSDATRDVATIDTLIAETQANLQRGYAIERELYTGTGIDLCLGSWRNRVGMSYCTVPETRVSTRPVTIDTATEKRKLHELQQARKRAENTARNKLASCEARYPSP